MGLGGILMFPFTIMYNLVTRLRNHLYNIGYTRTFKFEVKVIAVGNLNVGGTGKTPMLELLINHFGKQYQVATLSRGYARKTRGFRIASANDNAISLGDEPYQFYRKFKDKITVAVGEDRALAIPEILFHKPEINLILLDDAYQHRSVTPDFNILLTDFHKPFFKDFVLPTGRLREARSGAKRANVIVVTKCPSDLSSSKQNEYQKNIKKYAEDVPVFFSTIEYLQPELVYVKGNAHLKQANEKTDVLLVSAIAKPEILEMEIREKYNLIQHILYNDHHLFTINDAKKIVSDFEKIAGKNKIILVTEKDMVKLLQDDVKNLIGHLPIYYIPIKTKIIANEYKFLELVSKSVA